MASSGTVADPTIVHRERLGHDSVIIGGKVRIKSTATIEAGDLTLRTIKSAVFTPYDGPVRSGGPPTLFGSVTLSGSLMNNVRVRSFRGSIVPHTGTQHVGTATGGTLMAGFMIFGA